MALKFIAIEGGGTSWVVAMADGPVDKITVDDLSPLTHNNLVCIKERKSFDTTTSPHEVLSQIRQWISERLPISAIGVASFGPVDCNRLSKTYGCITSTPKKGWRDTNVLDLLGLYDEFKSIPRLFDTDVNAPAMAEYQMHMLPRGLSSCAYITGETLCCIALIIITW